MYTRLGNTFLVTACITETTLNRPYSPKPLCTHRTCLNPVAPQNAQSLIQSDILSGLNMEGKRLISAIVREHGNAIYPPHEKPLKDIVCSYSSLTGSNKWLLSSIMLLVFRLVLQSPASMVS